MVSIMQCSTRGKRSKQHDIVSYTYGTFVITQDVPPLAGEPVVAHPPYSLQTTQQCHCKQQVYSASSQMSVPWRMAHIQMNECLLMVQGLDRPHAEQRLWQAWQAGRSRWCPRHDSGQAHVPGLPDPGPDSSQCLAHFCSQD